MSQELDVFAPLKAEIAATVAPTLQIAVVDGQTSESALDAAKTIKEIRKRLDDKRRELVDPLNKEVKEINAYCKEIDEPLVQAEMHIRTQLNAYAVELEKRRQEELRRAEEERRRQGAELRAKQEAERRAVLEAAELFGEDVVEVEAEVEQKQEAERITALVEHKAKVFDANEAQIRNTRRNAKIKVIDLSAVPKEFLIVQVNEKAAIAAMKAGIKIPGLEIEYELSVSIGAKTRVGSRVL